MLIRWVQEGAGPISHKSSWGELLYFRKEKKKKENCSASSTVWENRKLPVQSEVGHIPETNRKCISPIFVA